MTDRTAFERHFALTPRQQAQHKDGSYRDASIQDRWIGWRAGHSAALEDAAKIAYAESVEIRDFDDGVGVAACSQIGMKIQDLKTAQTVPIKRCGGCWELVTRCACA